MSAPNIRDAQDEPRDSLGDRMKAYEVAHRTALPARSWVVIRLDGKAFHSWTRGLERPFSQPLLGAMAATMLDLCEEIPGVVVGYCQSDEISLVVQDFKRAGTQPWFGGGTQKIVSVSAGMCSALFSRRFPDRAPAIFDSRAFAVPNRTEVANYLLWRQADARRNAIRMLAHHHFGPKRLMGVPTDECARLLETEAGVFMGDVDPRFAHGQLAQPVTRREIVSFTRRDGTTGTSSGPVERSVWEVDAAPTLDADLDGVLLGELLPADPEQRRARAGAAR